MGGQVAISSIGTTSGTPTIEMYVNGVQGLTSDESRSQSVGTGGIGARGGGGNPSNCTIQELIIYDSDQSANRGTVTTGGGTGIEGNINTYFDIV